MSDSNADIVRLLLELLPSPLPFNDWNSCLHALLREAGRDPVSFSSAHWQTSMKTRFGSTWRQALQLPPNLDLLLSAARDAAFALQSDPTPSELQSQLQRLPIPISWNAWQRFFKLPSTTSYRIYLIYHAETLRLQLELHNSIPCCRGTSVTYIHFRKSVRRLGHCGPPDSTGQVVAQGEIALVDAFPSCTPTRGDAEPSAVSTSVASSLRKTPSSCLPAAPPTPRQTCSPSASSTSPSCQRHQFEEPPARQTKLHARMRRPRSFHCFQHLACVSPSAWPHDEVIAARNASGSCRIFLLSSCLFLHAPTLHFPHPIPPWHPQITISNVPLPARPPRRRDKGHDLAWMLDVFFVHQLFVPQTHNDILKTTITIEFFQLALVRSGLTTITCSEDSKKLRKHLGPVTAVNTELHRLGLSPLFIYLLMHGLLLSHQLSFTLPSLKL